MQLKYLIVCFSIYFSLFFFSFSLQPNILFFSCFVWFSFSASFEIINFVKFNKDHQLVSQNEQNRKFKIYCHFEFPFRCNSFRLLPDGSVDSRSTSFSNRCRLIYRFVRRTFLVPFYFQDLGMRFNHFILAESPTFNTVKNFLHMIWSQKSTFVLCLNANDESPIQFISKKLNVEQAFGDFTVIVTSETERAHLIEKCVKLTSSEANEIREILVLQAKTWTAKQ